MEDKRLEVVKQILGGGVRFRLPAPFFLRWLRPSITIRSLKAGSIFCFSEIVLQHQLEQVLLLGENEQLHKSIKPVAECIAVSALNGYLRIMLFKKILRWYLVWQVSAKSLKNMFEIVFELNNTKAFSITTKWYVHQTMTMMNPNLGR